MNERFEVELTKPEYVVGLEALTGELARRDKNAARRLYERLAIMVLLILAIGFLFPEALTGIFVAIIAWGVVEWLMARRWIGKAHGVSFDPEVGSVSIQFTDTGIADTAAHRNRQWQWSAVRKVHVRDTALVFELVGWDMIILPTRLWPDANARGAFLEEVTSKLPDCSEGVVSAMAAPPMLAAEWFRLAAIAAFVDVCLIISLLLPAYTRRYGPLADQAGFAGGMLLVMLISALLGYVAYRIAKVGLPKLHARSPLAANTLAQALIWAFAVWFGGALLRLW